MKKHEPLHLSRYPASEIFQVTEDQRARLCSENVQRCVEFRENPPPAPQNNYKPVRLMATVPYPARKAA